MTELAHILSSLTEANDALPQQQRLYLLLKAAILRGDLAPGQRLPASRQLASGQGMARNSVLYAYQQLQAEGFIDASRQGSRVAHLPVPRQSESLRAAPPGSRLLSQRASRLQVRQGESVLPFAPGVPDLNAFPWSSWARCLQKAWGEVSARQLAYAEPGGEPALRASVAAFLRSRRGVNCDPAQVFIVAGAQMAVDACARLLADPGDTVWLENPCYQVARAAMQAAALNIVDVPVDQAGMAADEALWQQHPPRLVYLTPSHQYPMGSVLSLERRLDFLRRIRPGEGWIIEDDYDSEFNHARPGYRPLPAMQGLVDDAPVIYIGTFSKLIYPGLRLAYMVVPPWAVPPIGQAIESLYRSGQAVEQRALARFLDSGRLTRHMRDMAGVYRQRQAVLRQALHDILGADIEIMGGDAGLHLVVLLPHGPADCLIVHEAAELGVTVRALSTYFSSGSTQPPGNGLLLGYGMVAENQIPALVMRLKQAIERACRSAAPGGQSCDSIPLKPL